DINGDTNMTVTLVATHRLSGVVRDSRGVPVSGVLVQASGSASSATVTSGADGSYALALPSGTYTLGVSDTSSSGPASLPNQWLESASLVVSGDRSEDVVVAVRAVDVRVVGPDG